MITNVSGNALPARLAFAGFAEGGALAKIAATWAGAAYPNAQTRSITFGAPRVGDDRRVRSLLMPHSCLAFQIWEPGVCRKRESPPPGHAQYADAYIIPFRIS